MWIEAILTILAIPVGILLAKLASDELLAGRKWFLVLCLVSFLGAAASIVFANTVTAFSLLFILICSAISYWASFSKKLTGQNV